MTSAWERSLFENRPCCKHFKSLSSPMVPFMDAGVPRAPLWRPHSPISSYRITVPRLAFSSEEERGAQTHQGGGPSWIGASGRDGWGHRASSHRASEESEWSPGWHTMGRERLLPFLERDLLHTPGIFRIRPPPGEPVMSICTRTCAHTRYLEEASPKSMASKLGGTAFGVTGGGPLSLRATWLKEPGDLGMLTFFCGRVR